MVLYLVMVNELGLWICVSRSNVEQAKAIYSKAYGSKPGLYGLIAQPFAIGITGALAPDYKIYIMLWD